MSKKFTEEQFKQLVKIQEKYFPHNVLENGLGVGSHRQAIHEYDIKMSDFIWVENLENEAVAIMNPRTREWAHEQFVEKENKYVWQSKLATDSGKVKRLYDSAIGITDSFKEKTEPIHNGNLITETEVKKWGYNPVMFDKEEA